MHYPNQFILLKAIHQNDLENLVLAIKDDEKIMISADSNYPIRKAFANGYTDIVNLLWKNKTVKNTLEKDHNVLYNNLKLKDIQNKLNKF